MSQRIDDWEKMDRGTRLNERVVGLGPRGTFHIYQKTVETLFGEDGINGRRVEIRAKPEGDAFAVVFDSGDPNYTFSGQHTASITMRSALQKMGVETPEETVHLDYEWDEASQTMIVDLSDLR